MVGDDGDMQALGDLDDVLQAVAGEPLLGAAVAGIDVRAHAADGVSAPNADVDATLVMAVNHHRVRILAVEPGLQRPSAGTRCHGGRPGE
jgi:hypothetical protein